jgi:hypothetical protein
MDIVHKHSSPVRINSSLNQLSISLLLGTHYLVEAKKIRFHALPYPTFAHPFMVRSLSTGAASHISCKRPLLLNYILHTRLPNGNTSCKTACSRPALVAKKGIMELCHSCDVVTRDIKWWVNSCRSTAIWDEEEEEKGRHATATLIKTTLAAVLLVAYSSHTASVNIS